MHFMYVTLQGETYVILKIEPQEYKLENAFTPYVIRYANNGYD